jgi:hypothetical protein
MKIICHFNKDFLKAAISCMCIFLGIISLTSIDFVNIRDEILMKAVGRMCPHLKEVTFSELLHTDAIPPDQLFSILTTEWPKVNCLNINLIEFTNLC